MKKKCEISDLIGGLNVIESVSQTLAASNNIFTIKTKELIPLGSKDYVDSNNMIRMPRRFVIRGTIQEIYEEVS